MLASTGGAGDAANGEPAFAAADALGDGCGDRLGCDDDDAAAAALGDAAEFRGESAGPRDLGDAGGTSETRALPNSPTGTARDAVKKESAAAAARAARAALSEAMRALASAVERALDGAD